MKIAHIIATKHVGGIIKCAADTINVLATQQNPDQPPINQIVIAAQKKFLDHHLAPNTPCYQLPFFNKFDAYSRARTAQIIADYNPDIIQCWASKSALFCPKTEAYQRTTIGWHGGFYKAKNFQHCTHHVAITEGIKSHIAENLYIPTEKIKYIPVISPVQTSLIETANTTPDITRRPKHLVCLSRISEEKGLFRLLQAMLLLPDFTLDIIGSGPSRFARSIKKFIRTHGLQNRVLLTDWQNDVTSTLKGAEMLVFPSAVDSFGAVMLEAWQTDTPLVTCRCPGSLEYVQHGQNGLLTPDNTPANLAKAIAELSENKPLQTALIAGGQYTAKTHFSAATVGANYADFYASMRNEAAS